jgi:hypothetical protein
MKTKPESHFHYIHTGKREGVAEVIERPDYFEVKLSFDKYGDYGDVPALKAWLKSIFDPLQQDPRPVYMRNPHTGVRAMTFDGFAIIAPGKDPGKKPSKA